MSKLETKIKTDSPTTPAMRQFKAFKKERPDCVLFFRMGDFYETFYDDAVLCHRVLGITLTERTKGIPMAGVPFHSVENYLRRMIEAGYRVAVADQIQDPKEARGIVDRAVTRVITPGTLIDESLLDDSRSNLVAAVLFHESGEESRASIAVAELSTGWFEILDASGGDVAGEVARLSPNELLYVETSAGSAPARVERLVSGGTCALTPRASWHFRHAEGFEALTGHFGVNSLVGFGISDDDCAIGPAGALIRYFIETQTGGAAGSSRLNHLRPPHRRISDRYMVVDATSLQSLEIERTMRSGQVEGSLLGVFGSCLTPMGKRELRRWLCFPLREISEIRHRQRCVGVLIEDRQLTDELGVVLREIQDVARIAGRISMGRATPRDLVGLGLSLAPMGRLIEALDQRGAFEREFGVLSRLRDNLSPLSERIARDCVEAPPAHMREGGLFRDGVDAILDEARSLQRDASEWLTSYQERIIRESGVANMKVGFNRVFGYYIEVSRANASRVPDTFTRKQTLKNAERYITPELKEFETKVLNADQRAIDREQVLFAELCGVAAEETRSLAEFADAIATIDVLLCFARRALKRQYVCPEMVDKPVLLIRGGRHPVLDELLREKFVPNDCRLNCAEAGGGEEEDGSAEGDEPRKTLALITGPNMAGKSTYIRQSALLTILAHTGSYIPAEVATIGLTDRVFTRIGASDELHAGRSTFMVEMTETANILHYATDHSLVILDEIGRGTSTLDGLSLAWAIAEYLAEVRARTFFATHYHELTEIAETLPNVCNLNVAVREWDDQVIFLYRILPGQTDRSYGIHVARIAGLPRSVINRANDVLGTLEVQTERTIRAERSGVGRTAGWSGSGGADGQLPLFTEYVPHPVVDELKRIDLDELSPIQAFELLRRMKREAEGEGAEG